MWRKLPAVLLSYLPSKRLIVLVASISISGAGLWLVAKSKEQPPRTKPPESIAAKNGPTMTSSAPTSYTFKQSKIVGQEAINEHSVALPTDAFLRSALPLIASQQASEEDIKKISEEAKLNLDKITSETKDIYEAKDVKIRKDASVRVYLNEIGRITQENFTGRPAGAQYDSETALLDDLSKKKIDFESATGDFQIFSKRYADAANDLKNTSVPEEMTSFHVELVNSFANTGLSLMQLALMNTDPLVAVAGLQTYGEEIMRSIALIYGMRDISQKYNIVFLASEPGYELQEYFKRI